MPGLDARPCHPVLKVSGDRLSAVALAPKAVVGAVMRKFAYLIYVVLKSSQSFVSKLPVLRLYLTQSFANHLPHQSSNLGTGETHLLPDQFEGNERDAHARYSDSRSCLSPSGHPLELAKLKSLIAVLVAVR